MRHFQPTSTARSAVNGFFVGRSGAGTPRRAICAVAFAACKQQHSQHHSHAQQKRPHVLSGYKVKPRTAGTGKKDKASAAPADTSTVESPMNSLARALPGSLALRSDFDPFGSLSNSFGSLFNQSFHRAPALRRAPCTRKRVLDIQNPIDSQRYVTAGITNGLTCSRNVGRLRVAQRRQRFVFGFLIIHHFYQLLTSA
ncbi:hypothetical protein T492DRAFT_868657 [Pavlovales sp. CCMP2436]|nr:hypothetical protein T492DRAFT_868657 [Pavlovales sp. CCMP2436]